MINFNVFVFKTDLTMRDMDASESQSTSALERKTAQIDEMHRAADELRGQIASQQRLVEEQKTKLAKCREMTKKLLIEQVSMFCIEFKNFSKMIFLSL